MARIVQGLYNVSGGVGTGGGVGLIANSPIIHSRLAHSSKVFHSRMVPTSFYDLQMGVFCDGRDKQTDKLTDGHCDSRPELAWGRFSKKHTKIMSTTDSLLFIRSSAVYFE